MARIRSVHPDITRDETLAEVSASAERTFVRLWCYLDDDGRAADNLKLLKADLYPLHDEMTGEMIDDDLDELAAAGLILRYEVGGKHFLCAKPESWTEYQKPRHPKPSELPSADEGTIRDVSANENRPEPTKNPPGNGRRNPTAESSDLGRNPTAHPPEQCGNPTAESSETFRGEGEGVGVGVNNTIVDFDKRKSTELALIQPDPVREVFDEWRESTGKTRAKLDAKRRRTIKRALETYPVEDLIAAVHGWKHSPHHRGENDRQTVYNELTLLLRDAERIEQFRDLTLHGPTQAGPQPKGMAAVERFAQRHGVI